MIVLHICGDGSKVWGVVDLSVPMAQGIASEGPRAGKSYVAMVVRPLFRSGTIQGYENVARLMAEKKKS